MPVLSRRGRVAMGIGDGVISVDGAVPSPLVGVIGGGTCWLDDDTIVYQRASGQAYIIEALHLPSLVPSTVSETGANHLVAGGGVWATWLAGHGYRDSHGRAESKWYPLAVDPSSGHVAICLDYQTGAGIGVWTGTAIVTVASAPLDRLEASYRGGVLSYRASGRVHLWRDGAVQTLSPLPFVAGVEHDGGWLLGWHEGHGLVLYRAGHVVGMVVSADGRDFHPRVRLDASGLVQVVSSAGAGEWPHELRQYSINPVLGTVNGQPAVMVDLTTQPLRVPAIEPIPHPCWVAPYKTWNGRPDYGQHVTSAPAMVLTPRDDTSIVIAEVRVQPGVDGPYFVGDFAAIDGSRRVPDDRFLGHCLSLEGGHTVGDNTPSDAREEFEHELPLLKADCVARKRPLYLLLDGHYRPDSTGHFPDWADFLARYAQPEPGLEIVPMFEMYASAHLDDATLESDWDALAGWLRSQGYRVAAATTLYTQPGADKDGDGKFDDFYPVQRILDLQPRIRRVVVKHGIHLVAPFCVGRPGGVVTHPIFSTVLDAWTAAVPREHPPVVVLPEPAPVEPPVVPPVLPPDQPDEPDPPVGGFPDPFPEPIPAEPGQYPPWQPRDNWFIRLLKAIVRIK